MTVEYDSATYTAVLTTGDQVIASRPDGSQYITRSRPGTSALTDAGGERRRRGVPQDPAGLGRRPRGV